MFNCRLFREILLVPFLTLLAFLCEAQASSWTHTWGGSNDDGGGSVALDRNGNIYVAGSTSSFGAGLSDVLLLKYDSSGNPLWARTWGGSNQDGATAVAVDSSGNNVYVTGATRSFTAGWYDAFILKFDSSGSPIWNRTWGGSSYDVAHDISFDNSGNIYVAAEAYSYGNACAATVLKFNSNGEFLWSRTWDGSDPGTVYDAAYSIEVDSNGNIYLAGTSWFYPQDSRKILLLKFDSSGNFLWVRRWSVSYRDEGPSDIIVDSNGNIYLGGGTLFGAGDYDALVLKFDTNGDLIWSKTWGGSGLEFAWGHTLGSDGNIYVAGQTGSFGQGKDVLLLKYDSTGSLLSQKIFGESGDQAAGSIIMGGMGDVFLAGSAPNNSGTWQDVTGTTGAPTGTLSSPSGSVASPAGVITSPTATVTSPSGVIDIGGGGADALVLKYVQGEVYDLGFRPNRDGWQFGNGWTDDAPPYNGDHIMWPEYWWSRFDYSQDPLLDPHDPFYINSSRRFPDWFLFVDAFGHEQCYWSDDVPKEKALKLWKALSKPHFKWLPPHYSYWSGSCFGFAISSFLAFDDKSAFLNEFPNVGNFDNLHGLLINDDRRKCINKLWIYQFGKNQLAHIEESKKSKTPVQTLNECRQMFLSETRNDKILVFFNQNGCGAHAVNPYRIGAGTDVDTIFIYDNNHPDSDNKYITVDKVSNTWFAPGYFNWNLKNWGGNKGLFLMDPVSNYLTNPVLPKKLPPKEEYISKTSNGTDYIEFFNTPSCNATILDSLGKAIGYQYENDSLFSDFDDGMHIIPITGTEDPPIGYFLPSGSYSIQMSDYADTSMYVSVFSNSTVFSYTCPEVIPANSDKFIYENNGTRFKVFNSDAQSKNFDLKTIIVGSDNEKVFGIENCIISQNDSLAFDIVNQKDFEISNKGQSKSYDLRVRLAGTNTDIIFEHKEIAMSSYSSHKITPVWDDLENQLVPILIDENMDGVIDDTLLVENQYQETPPTGGALNNDNVYCYPNPFNPDEEVGTIRYSLSKPGNVTIKIYDISNALVRTLIEDIPKEAGTELSEEWNGRNDKGDIVANGIYFYVIESSSGEKGVGKVAVLR